MPLTKRLSLTGLLEARRLAPAKVGRAEVTALRRMLKRVLVVAGITDMLLGM